MACIPISAVTVSIIIEKKNDSTQIDSHQRMEYL